MTIIFIIAVLFVFYLITSTRIDRLERQIAELRGELLKPDPEEAPSVSEPVVSEEPEELLEAPEPDYAETEREQEPLFKKDEDAEFQIGSKVFTIIGAVALIFGVGFFLRYAFEHNLLTETARVVLGVVSGVGAILFGGYISKKYAVYGQVITGGGLGILYLSFYASYSFYELLAQPVAFFFMAAVTVTGIVLAVLYNSPQLMGLAVAGGFITPVLLAGDNPSPHSLFLYLLLLNAGVLAVAFKRSWPYITLGSLIGTVLLFAGWLEAHHEGNFLPALIYATVFFLIFFITSMLHQLLKRREQQKGVDLALLLATPFFYFLAGYFLIMQNHNALGVGVFTAILASFYLGFALSLRISFGDKEQHLFNQMLLMVSFVFYAISVPFLISGPWITIIWGAFALAMLILGFTLKLRGAWAMGVSLFFLALLRLTVFDSSLSTEAVAWLNMRTLVYTFISGFLAAAAVFLFNAKKDVERYDDGTPGFSNELSYVSAIFSVLAVAVSVLGVSLEIAEFQRHFWLTLFWLFAALAAGVLGLFVKDKALRASAYVLYVLAGFRILLYDGYVSLPNHTSVFNERVLVFLVAIASVSAFAWLLKAREESIDKEERDTVLPALFISANGLVFWLLTAEVADYFNKRMHDAGTRELENMKRAFISITWLLYAITALVVGIAKRSEAARKAAIIVFAVVIAKVFLYDTVNLDDLYRFISFIALGLILLLTGYLYYKYKDRIMQFIEAQEEESEA